MLSLRRLALATVLSGLLASPTLAQSSSQPIMIGASTPLTGPVSWFGQHARWGSQLAVDEANAKGGINGRKIEIDYQDNRCNPAEAVKSVSQMLATKKYAAIFDGLCSSAALAIMPLIERAKVPFVVANASATSVAEKSGEGGNKWTFKVNPTDASMLDALAGWLHKENKLDNIAFLGEDTDYGRAGSSGMEAALAKYGKKLIMTEYSQKGATDFTSVITKIKARKPNMVALYLIDADFQNGIKQWYTMGGGIPFTGRLVIEQVPKEILASGFLDGTITVQPYDTAVDTPANKEFVDKFNKKYGAPPMLVSFESYETTSILIEAMRKSGDASPEKIRDALTKTKYQSMLGPVLEFDSHNLIHNNAVILGVKGGKVAVLGLSKT
jgi:branched-chain amino acid transport system substrate-binding protein